MSTKTTIIGALGIFLLIAGVMIWLFISENQTTEGEFRSGTNGFLNFFPFGNQPTTDNRQPTTGNGTTEENREAELKNLQQLSSMSVAGAVVFSDNGKLFVRFTERSTGHTYDVPAEGGTLKRVSNTTVPKVYEALWFPNATSSVILRYLGSSENITTYSATLRDNGIEKELGGIFLPRNTKSIALSPDGKRVAYLVEGASGASVMTSNTDGGKKTEVFSSPVNDWQVGFPSTATLTLSTKPSGGAFGYFYALTLSNLKMTRLLGDRAGLTALANPTLSRVVFSESTERSLSLKQLTTKNGAVTDLPLATLARDKCIWDRSDTLLLCAVPSDLPPALYPDAWYQGTVSFTDSLWQLDLESGNATLIDLLDVPLGLDVEKPFQDSKGDFFFFTNKKDGTLWALRLTE